MRTASTASAAVAYVPRPDPPSPLRLRRIRSGLTLNDLSVETGIQPSRLSYIERGRQPVTTTEQRTINEALRRIATRGKS